MTGNVVIDLAISLTGVVILVALARVIFGKVDAPFALDAVRERLAFDEPDFKAVDWLIDESAKAALARNEAGEIAIVTAHGDGLVTRRIAAGRMRAHYGEGKLTVDPVDHTTGRAHFVTDGETARAWLAHLRAG